MYTPTSPRDLEVKVDVRRDANGDLHPVILAQWKARDDGKRDQSVVVVYYEGAITI